jgi:spore coat protein U-like protein
MTRARNPKLRFLLFKRLVVWSNRPLAVMPWLLAAALALVPQRVLAIGETCTVQASGVNFGIYDPFNSTPTDATGTASVTCSALASVLVSYTIRLSTGGSGSYASRTLTSGSYTLNYNLYTSAAHAAIWGDGSAGTSTVSDSYLLEIGSVTRDYPVYGRIPAAQNAAVGTYSDTITVTVDY